MRVHKNLNKGCWTVTPKGERVTHVDAFALAGVVFKVSAAGRKRVVERGVRAVHAWAEGSPVLAPEDLAGFVRVSYNPFRSGSFVRVDTGAEVVSAKVVVFTSAGECLAELSDE